MIIGELRRQAANRPQSLKGEGSSEELVVNGTIYLADLVMVIAARWPAGRSFARWSITSSRSDAGKGSHQCLIVLETAGSVASRA
jgi:hypothetical protein